MHGSVLLFVESSNQATAILGESSDLVSVLETLRFLELSSEYWYMCHSFREHVEKYMWLFWEHWIISVLEVSVICGGGMLSREQWVE